MKKRKRKKKKNRGLKRILISLVIFICLSMVFLVARVVQLQLTKEMKTVESREAFYENLAPLAQKTGEKHGLFPSVILAQAALESGFAQSKLTVNYNNYFGIKAGNSSKSILLPTVEIEDGVAKDELAEFRFYETVEESFADYGNLVGNAPRYENVRAASSPEEAANALYPSGYSTNPKYGELLIQIIERDQLKQYDS